jgi:hypothetical protein
MPTLHARALTRAWRHVATIEVGQDLPDFKQLVDDSTVRFRIEPSPRSPAGYRWFDFYLEAAATSRDAARTTWALLWRLKRLHESGELKDFRIVRGQQYLDLGDANAAMGVDGMTPENLPREE